ncbi:hypothetical protein HDU98_004577 [Podochytrium sp. JEL0797]|nr:hypothetical protein HDU98_004577 [Podochytrium sp. JEL0797]
MAPPPTESATPDPLRQVLHRLGQEDHDSDTEPATAHSVFALLERAGSHLSSQGLAAPPLVSDSASTRLVVSEILLSDETQVALSPSSSNDSAPFDSAPFDAAPFDAAQFDAAPFDAAQFDAAQFDAAQFDAAQFDAAQFDAAQFDAAKTRQTTKMRFASTSSSDGAIDDERVGRIGSGSLSRKNSLVTSCFAENNSDQECISHIDKVLGQVSLMRRPSASSMSKKTHIKLANTAVGLREIAKKLDLIVFTKDLALWLINECNMTVLVEDRMRETHEFAPFCDIEEYNIITEYGAPTPSGLPQPGFPRTPISSSLPASPLPPHLRHFTNQLSNGSFVPTVVNNLLFWSPEDFKYPLKTDPLSSKIDLIVTLGGDGTVLFTAGLFESVKVPPIVPFDLGSLGFLAVFEFEKAKDVLRKVLGIPDPTTATLTPTIAALESNTATLESNTVSLESTTTSLSPSNPSNTPPHPTSSQDLSFAYENLPRDPVSSCHSHTCFFHVNMRLRLACSIHRMDPETGIVDPTAEETFHVLNELVVDRGPSAIMSHLELFVDGSHLTTSMADGLVVATPTGSTAYSLSAGGSIVHPLVPALLVTPICPHTLSFRPMLLPESIELKVQVPLDARGTAWVSFDGKKRREVMRGDEVRVEVSRFGVPTVCRQDQSRDWIESLRRCLHWNVRTKQKGFK